MEEMKHQGCSNDRSLYQVCMHIRLMKSVLRVQTVLSLRLYTLIIKPGFMLVNLFM